MQLLQWGPLLYQGSDIESRFVAHGYVAKEGDTADTARKGWELFFEDVDRLAEGNDQDGTPVAQDEDGTKWKYVLTFNQNDFEIDGEHGCPNFRMAMYFCKHCRATNGKTPRTNPYPFSDLTPSAAWRRFPVNNNLTYKPVSYTHLTLPTKRIV